MGGLVSTLGQRHLWGKKKIRRVGIRIGNFNDSELWGSQLSMESVALGVNMFSVSGGVQIEMIFKYSLAKPKLSQHLNW